MTVLYGAAVTLRPIRHDDVARITEILAQPEVARWWGRYDEDRVQSELVAARPDVTVLSVEYEDRLVGCVQYNEEPAPDYRHASVDVFLDAEVHGQGLGTDAVRTLARHLVHDRGHHRLAIDPAAANERAIKTYTRVGFKPVGVMRSYERTADGQWQDALLMDLLKRDLH